MSETSKELPEIKLALGSRPDVRVFRNVVTAAWVGNLPMEVAYRYKMRRIITGLTAGSGDLIGMRRYVCRLEDVGKCVAVFTSAEAKAGSAKPRANQMHWLKFVNDFGGIGCWANSAESAVEQVTQWHPQ